MMDTLINGMNMGVLQFHTILIILTVLLHLVCATAIASNIGQLHKRNIVPAMMPGSGWVLAGLITGVWGLLIYWLMHHSSLAR